MNGSTFTTITSQIENSNGNKITIASTDESHGNQVTSITDTVGRAVTFTWAAAPNNSLSSVSYKDSNGLTQTTTFSYANVSIAPTFQTPQTVQSPENWTGVFLSTITLPNLLTYTFQYNNFAEIAKVTYPMGGYSRYDYSAYQFYWSFDGGSGGASTAADFREVTARHVCSSATGSCTTEDTTTDPMGNVTTNTYDSNGNLLTVPTPAPNSSTAASVTRFAYNSLGELTQITDPLNNKTTIAYFPAGLIQTITDAQNNVTTYGYDTHGNRTSVTDAAQIQTTFAYDAGDRLKTITYPGSTGTTGFTYDNRGRRTSVTEQNNKTTTYAYDDADRLTSVTDAATPGNVTTYGYDTENNLLSIQDANNHTTTFAYDAFGRVTRTTFPSTLAEFYYYDAVGNLITKTDRKNQTVSYTYDQLNRLAQKTYPDNSTVNYAYDNDSRLTQVTDPTGTYQFTFDNMGRLTNTTTSYAFLAGRNFTTSYGYDAASNRTGFTDPESGATSYVYDTLNRLQTLTPPAAFTATGNFGFSYDALSRRTQMTRPNGLKSVYAYDNLSRLQSVLHQSGSTTLDGASYGVDNAGNRTSRTPQPAGTTSNYGYDALYELTSVTQGSTTTESYTYDPVGNRLSSLGVSPYANNASNELTSIPGTTYTYDNNGNTQTKVVGSNTTSYSWDFENRLTSVTLPGSGGAVSFKYDPFGRRIYKSSSSGTSVYAYDDKNLIEETNSSGAAVARYSQTQSIDEPLAMLRSGTTSYYHADGLGSVTSLSNGAGALAQTYTFDSFGNQTASSGSLTNPFRFAGREFDPESSLYFMRARYFDPATGRFTSEDPNDKGSLYSDLNLYVYTENNPTNWTDPLGLYTLKKGGKHPPLPPSPEIDKLLNCIESKTGLNLTVTSTSEDTPEHPPGSKHRRGVAVDLRYDPGNADKILCAAAGCGAGFGLDEAKHPSPQSTGNHIHLQIPAGTKGGHGDLPKNTCSGNGCKP